MFKYALFSSTVLGVLSASLFSYGQLSFTQNATIKLRGSVSLTSGVSMSFGTVILDDDGGAEIKLDTNGALQTIKGTTINGRNPVHAGEFMLKIDGGYDTIDYNLDNGATPLQGYDLNPFYLRCTDGAGNTGVVATETEFLPGESNNFSIDANNNYDLTCKIGAKLLITNRKGDTGLKSIPYTIDAVVQ